VLLIAAISAVAISRVRREPALLFGWAWFLVMLIPVLGLVQVGMQARADRYTYLPQIGLAIAGVWGVGGAVLRRHSRWLSALAAAAAVSALLALAVTARQQVHHWRNTQALFEHALAHTQGNYIALQILGDEAARADHLDEAERLYRESLSLKDDWAPTHADLGRLQVRQGRVEDAIRSFAISARLDRQSVDARTALASTLISVERFAGADAALADAAALDPLDAEIPANRSVVAFATGDRASALQHGREALRLGPQSPIAANLVAWILSTHPDPKKRDPEEALRVARLGLALAGDEEHLLLGSLAASLAAAGRFEEATATAERLVAYFEANDEPALAQQARSHAQLYRSGQALVEPDVKSR
jgi:tetratricopeptide (TPR) repeat protein